ncbi:hypothetical protein C1I98_11030 [Spongiactinospora gelatinilytica]|uniref:Uncharacterized protein n=1 Tax=Spongiactinospora gelatinilytica TaxID=2666298 RepID=A0A2W2GPP4_9ACTN|nr:hypothetical protein [Spongiactinospora gelatinilytica]PZG49842.1 hypothetical protein C1I98_11030 [Spongiactinospora gelatinilytica]
MSQRYEPGEIVDITITGARVLTHTDGSLVYEYEYGEAGATDREEVRHEASAVTITRRVPAAGMPRPNEVWEDDLGIRYLVVESEGQVRLHDGAPSGSRSVEHIHEVYGPITPLIRDEPGREDITPDIAKQVLWWFGQGSEGGAEGSTFENGLIGTIVHAPKEERRRLAREYPGYVQAVYWAEAPDGGIDDLRKIAERAS